MGQLWSTPIQRYKGILEVAKRKGNKKEEAQAYLDLGEAYEENGEPAKAKRCFNNALKIAKDQKDMEQEKNAYNGLASASASSNEFQLAIEYLDKASKVELISYGNQNLSKLQDEVTIEKLSTSDANKRWSTVVGKLTTIKTSTSLCSSH
jgi:tetratricopeptide (TPR) repeat protein